eukprot:357212-Chlamydomonas_euryale.AAC.3
MSQRLHTSIQMHSCAVLAASAADVDYILARSVAEPLTITSDGPPPNTGPLQACNPELLRVDLCAASRSPAHPTPCFPYSWNCMRLHLANSQTDHEWRASTHGAAT